MSAFYRVVPGPFYDPSRVATVRRYARFSDALAAMGTGLVVADDGRVIAFHESQLQAVTRLVESGRLVV